MAMNFRAPLAAAGLAAALCAAHAQPPAPAAATVQVGHPRARATLPGQPVAGGYLTLTNRGPADRLLSVSAAVSRTAELHAMSMDGDVMRMRQVQAIDLPAGQAVELRPGGLHIMFVGLKAPLKAGDTFPLTLRFERAGEQQVTVTVEPLDAGR
jgi:copper(I)-binding protein